MSEDFSLKPQCIKLGGITPFTATDFPGQLACVFFCQGCPWRCRYCHNPQLLKTKSEKGWDWEQALYFLRTRKKLLDAVVFSGGEPLLQKELKKAISDVKNLGFKVGLHTGGAFPNHLKQVLPLLDWVGFDIKAPFASYEKITQIKGSGDQALQSFYQIASSSVDVQLRTTVHPNLLSQENLNSINQEIQQVLRTSHRTLDNTPWILQSFRPQGCTDVSLRYTQTN